MPFSALLCPQLSGVLVLCRGLPPVFEGSAHTHVRAGGGGGNEDFAGLMPVYILSLSLSHSPLCRRGTVALRTLSSEMTITRLLEISP